MYLDVVHLREFYALPIGRTLRHIVGAELHRVWPNLSQLSILGVGYASPFLRLYLDQCAWCVAAMPAGQGVVAWPRERDNVAVLVDETELPLPDASVDRAMAVHGLEFAADPRGMLDEIWRVLKPGGRLLVVVPNRRSLWAGSEISPFGYGRPYSRRQLTQILVSAHFRLRVESEALFAPPSRRTLFLRSAHSIERLGRRLWPTFAGLTIMEAEKHHRQAKALGAQKLAHALKPVFLPQPANA